MTRPFGISLTITDGHTPLPIVMQFGINVLGTETEQHISKDFKIPLPFQNEGPFVGLFAVTKIRATSTGRITTGRPKEYILKQLTL